MYLVGLLISEQNCFWNEQNALRHNEKANSSNRRKTVKGVKILNTVPC